jgi:membrane-bound lytic murein transglycosylase D
VLRQTDMKRFCRYPGIALFGAVMLLTSCETADQKPATAPKPPQAQAPDLFTTEPKYKPPGIVEETPLPKPDPVEVTIAAVEREYQAGRDNYSTGHLEAAKSNFDRAFDMLLQSPVDVKADERLQREFDKIVEGVNQLELLALKQGDGFTEQRSEPAPIDEANEVTFPVDPNIKATAEAELKTTQSDLPLVLNDAVAAYINYFSSKGRGFLEHGYIRSGRYREMILATLKAEGVPQDLIYLAQAESGFHPLALSRVGARGMWQFMAGTGSLFGMKRSWWVDERQDPEKATRAAAKYLKDLHSQFGDWYLAMAAYNSGAITVQRAVQRTGYVDYWELYRRGVLPQETRNYVPIILAITIMSKNPAQYGLDRLRPDPPLPSDTVSLDSPVDLRLAAECADTSVSTLQELNPSLLRLTTPKDQPFELHLPPGGSEKFRTAIAAIPADMRVWWHYHRVTEGDTLGSIAKKYHTTAAAIQKVNSLETDDLQQDSKLIIPVAPGRPATESVSFSKRTTRYKVRKGDTVLSVADQFGVPVENLRKWNRLKGNALRTGQMLAIHKPLASSAEPEPGSRSTKKGAKTQVAASSRTRQPAKAAAAAQSKPKTVSKAQSRPGPQPAQGTKKATRTSARRTAHTGKKTKS